MLPFPVWATEPEGTIPVAAIYSLTGPAAKANASSVLGVRIGVETLNRGGGILGRKINLILIDNRSTPIGSSVAAEQAVRLKAAAIIGAAWSSHSLAVARVAQRNRIPMISNYATHPDLTAVGEYIFRVCYTDRLQGQVMACFARRDLGARTAISFVDLTSDFSLGLSGIFRDHFEHLGGRFLEEIEYKLKQPDFEPLVRSLRPPFPDVVLLAGHDESGWIAKALQDAGIPSVPLGGDGWSEGDFFVRGGRELKVGYYCTQWSPAIDDHRSQAFVDRYGALENFGVGTALAHDAVMLLADAAGRAGSADRRRIRDALAETAGFTGITGAITFDASGDPVKGAVIMSIRNGVPRFLKRLRPSPGVNGRNDSPKPRQ